MYDVCTWPWRSEDTLRNRFSPSISIRGLRARGGSLLTLLGPGIKLALSDLNGKHFVHWIILATPTLKDHPWSLRLRVNFIVKKMHSVWLTSTLTALSLFKGPVQSVLRLGDLIMIFCKISKMLHAFNTMAQNKNSHPQRKNQAEQGKVGLSKTRT